MADVPVRIWMLINCDWLNDFTLVSKWFTDCTPKSVDNPLLYLFVCNELPDFCGLIDWLYLYL